MNKLYNGYEIENIFPSSEKKNNKKEKERKKQLIEKF